MSFRSMEPGVQAEQAGGAGYSVALVCDLLESHRALIGRALLERRSGECTGQAAAFAEWDALG